MYNVISIEKRPYFIYNGVTDKTLKVRDFDGLIEVVARKFVSWESRKWNGIFTKNNDDNMLDSLDMTGNDTKFDPHLEELGYSSLGYKLYRGGYKHRQYRVTDSDGRVVDIRNYRELVLEKAKKLRENRAYASKVIKIKFRKDPVPLTGRNWHKYSWYRSVRTTSEIRKNSDPELQEFIRRARTITSLPSTWDDKTRGREKSWKHSCKVRKQYMKHFKDHGSSIKILYRELNKAETDEYEETFEFQGVA